MSGFSDRARARPRLLGMHRRAWLRHAAPFSAVLAGIWGRAAAGCLMQEKTTAPAKKNDLADAAARERERALVGVRAVTRGSQQSAETEHYQAIGDASESFMKVVLSDCELIAQDFLEYYKAKGFEVKPPKGRMTVVVFRDERPFFEFARRTVRNVPANVAGFYSRTENYLVLFDSRNVPAIQRGGALKNMRNLAHEATHQLSFNTGLLNRKGDVPAAVIEGLACFGETRRLRGRSDPGLLNSERLNDLAHLQRRMKWISTADLLTDDTPAGGRNFDRMQLFYAESWILIHTAMKTPERSAAFQEYLKRILPRADKKNRLADAAKCLGDLDRLDQEMRQEAIRLQREPRP